MHAGWSWTSSCCLAFCNADRVANVIFAEASALPRDFEVGDGGLRNREWCLNDFWDGLRGVREEREGREPDVMSFWGDGCEFESACWR